MIRLIKAKKYKKMPWKNGAGFTEEIIRVDQSESDRFLWRLSKAEVKEDGAFSSFTGYQRVLSIIEPKRMMLTINNDSPCLLNPFEAFAFSGDSAVTCRLLEGTLTDFNLIYDAQQIKASVGWLVDCGLFSSVMSDDQWLIFNAGCEVKVIIDDVAYILEGLDTLQLSNYNQLINIRINPISGLYMTCCIIKITEKNNSQCYLK